MNPPRALVLLARGAEEIETVAVVDVLRRGGVDVVLAGLDGPEPVPCSRGVVLSPDLGLGEAEGPFDAVVLPGGGEGARRLAESEAVAELLRGQEDSGRLVAAICAAPLALAAAGVGAGRALTSHPSARERLAAHGDYREERVVIDGGLVTSRGPGSAIEFALAILARLAGEQRVREVAEPMMMP
jgi:protein DJ-1